MPGDLDRFRSLLSQQLGFALDELGRESALESLLHERLGATGASSLAVYLQRFAHAGSADCVAEVAALAERVTIGETYFFRYADHFRAFVDVVLPERMEARRAERRLRFLCAGCSSGEEPATLAILLNEHLPALSSWDVSVLGVDLNPAAIARAQQGRYTTWSLREVDEATRQQWFRRDGRDFVLDPRARRLVRFERENLCDERAALWARDRYDAIFCRNVLMYFADDRARNVLASIKSSLVEGGFFFLGHAETHMGRTTGLRMLHTHETFYFQRDDVSGTRPESAFPPYVAGHISLRPPPPPAIDDNAWVDEIAQASQRIANLAAGPSRATPARAAPARAAPQQPAPTFDLGPALELLRQERFDDVMACLDGVPSANEADPSVLLLRAVVTTNRGEVQAAESACNKLLALSELRAGAHYLLGLCREQVGDLAAANDHYRTSLSFEPAFAMPHLRLGLLARAAGDRPMARRELGFALALLAEEDTTRVVLFGGGFSRELLEQLCRSELRASGGMP